MRRRWLFELALAGAMLAAVPAAADPASSYAEHCAACHGADRLGGQGPALLPENLGRLSGARAAAVIAEGREATQMPAFAHLLSKVEIEALAAYISSPLALVPRWGEAEIAASRVVHQDAPAIERPTHDADPLNLFVVVETGDHHATILDGDRLESLARFPTRFSLHCVPNF
jgi:mono/diheme cytochrome c family protein